MNFVLNREEVTETFRLHLLGRYWNFHCHRLHLHHCRLKTVKKLEGIPRTIETVTKTDSGGRWLYHSGLCSKEKPSPLPLRPVFEKPSPLPLRPVFKKPSPLQPHSPHPNYKWSSTHRTEPFCVAVLGTNEITGLFCYYFVDGIPLIFLGFWSRSGCNDDGYLNSSPTYAIHPIFFVVCR